MKIATFLLGLTLSAVVQSRSPQHVGKKLKPKHSHERRVPGPAPVVAKRDISKYSNERTQPFAVNGSAIPEVDFDIGESYAGLLPIDSSNSSELYFWFFPSTNPAAEKEILIWLNGGPGCSSLEGFLQENGPFQWQYGTYKPVPNTWSWTNLTNIVWVEQPVGTGFTQGTPTATSETDVAAQFLGFWKNFIETFCMEGYTVYIAGESYAGFYVPYIADAMLNTNDTTYYNLSSTMVYDGVYTYNVVEDQIPTAGFIDYWAPLLALNDTFVESIHNLSDACGYTDFMNDNYNFPPKGLLPSPPNIDNDNTTCDVWDAVINAATLVNPCFDVYQVATTCPLLWDVLGFPGSFPYEPADFIYFNRTDVQKAINAPLTNWEECSSIDVFVNGTDNSQFTGLSVLPGVIERSERTILGHGILDFILLYNGTVLAIQNMTWNGAQGFSKGPNDWDDFYVPYHDDPVLGSIAGAGVLGQTYSERGLTLVTVELSGHMVPQYAPSAAYRHVEYLLGRIPSLTTTVSFTTMGNSSAAAASNSTSTRR